MALPVSGAHAGGNEPGTLFGMTMRMQVDLHARMQPMLDDLRRLSGRAFDRSFFPMMTPHHGSATEMNRAALP